MEGDEIVIKEGPGLCRCCLSEGCYKDLASEYTWMNETEVYADMLLECFDISITQHNGGPNGPNRLICEVCITRLRDACNFKKQVLDSEKKFVDMVGRGKFKEIVMVYEQDIKPDIREESAVNDATEYLDDDIAFMDDDIKDKDYTEEPSSSEITVAALPIKAKRGRPKKDAAVSKSVKKAKLTKVAKGTKSETKAKAVKEFTIFIDRFGDQPGKSEMRGSKLQKKEELKMILFDGIQTKEPTVEKLTKKGALSKILFDILENTTAMPFRWHGNKYMCFFCCCQFVESSKLKEHTKEEHHGSRKRNVLRFLIGCGSVKLDVTDLSCKKCPKRIDNLDECLKHLSEAHDIRYDDGVSSNIYAFKLSDDGMNCLDCGAGHRFFGPLLMHVHKFHNKRKSFLCEICGQSFVGRGNVDSHVRTVHSNDQRICVKCDKVFTSHSSLSSHYNEVHFKERLKCPKCPEILGSSYLKKRHLALVHDVKSAQHKCKFCTKIFFHHSKLVAHIQRVHLKEKKIACDVCGFKVFNKDLLKRHMVKHDGSRPFECEFCKKTFQRKKTLEFHRRIHTNDKRYACKECGKAFVQFTSWKLHLRVHHSISN